MRWFVLILVLSLVHGATIRRECSVSEVVSIAYSIHDPKERAEKIWAWLEESGPLCTKEQLARVYANAGSMLGNADSMKIRAKIEQLYERAK